MRRFIAEPAGPGALCAWVVHCDGSAVPNPGRMGLGAVVAAPGGAARHTFAEATSFTGCNNEAELRALMLALRRLVQLAPARQEPVHIFSDSSVLVAQLGGAAAVPAIARLTPLFEEAQGLLRACGAGIHLHWVPRHRNREADALARAALGLAPKGPATSLGRKKKKRR